MSDCTAAIVDPIGAAELHALFKISDYPPIRRNRGVGLAIIDRPIAMQGAGSVQSQLWNGVRRCIKRRHCKLMRLWDVRWAHARRLSLCTLVTCGIQIAANLHFGRDCRGMLTNEMNATAWEAQPVAGLALTLQVPLLSRALVATSCCRRSAMATTTAGPSRALYLSRGFVAHACDTPPRSRGALPCLAQL